LEYQHRELSGIEYFVGRIHEVIGRNGLYFPVDDLDGLEFVKQHDGFPEAEEQIFLVVGGHGDLSDHLVLGPFQLEDAELL
jgi:hypothetical protein